MCNIVTSDLGRCRSPDRLAASHPQEVIGETAELRRLLLYDRHTWTLVSDTPLHYSMPLNGAGEQV